MSAQATFSEGAARRRLRALENMAACGPLSVIFVAAGGLATGFFLWYAGSTHSTAIASVSQAALAVALAIGLAAAFAGWSLYSVYFARRAGVGLVTAMRWDAVSWAGLTVYGVGLVMPVAVGTPTRWAAAAVGIFALVKLLVAARFVYTVRDVLVIFVTTRLPIIVVAELASVVIAQRPGTHVSASANPILNIWGRWDAVHYLDIARRGYYGTDMAFFPLYPLLIWAVGSFIGNDLVAGLFISNVALFFGLLFFYKLVEHQYNRSVAHRAIFYVSIFPTAIFFSAVYTEALFFALTVTSFYYIRERRWITAGILGACAALTRVEGILLIVPYLIEAFTPAGAGSWRHSFATPARAIRVAAGAVLIPAGLFCYMATLWVLRGDPLYFSHVQSHWNRRLAFPWASVAHSFKIIASTHSPATASTQAIELAFTTLMIAVFAFGFMRLRPSFSAYMALSILVPMCTSSLMSMPRFALVLFPMFVMLALWGGRSWVNNTVVAFSLTLLGLFTVLFADWYWVA
jgi:Gpi18-like mannosyltransferase